MKKQPEFGGVNYDTVMICALRSGNDHNAGRVFVSRA
jgi:hypothetical protein